MLTLSLLLGSAKNWKQGNDKQEILIPMQIITVHAKNRLPVLDSNKTINIVKKYTDAIEAEGIESSVSRHTL